MVRGDQPIQLENIEAVLNTQRLLPVQGNGGLLGKLIALLAFQVDPECIGLGAESAVRNLCVVFIMNLLPADLDTRWRGKLEAGYRLSVRITGGGQGDSGQSALVHGN